MHLELDKYNYLSCSIIQQRHAVRQQEIKLWAENKGNEYLIMLAVLGTSFFGQYQHRIYY
jgi:hypothetical protein